MSFMKTMDPGDGIDDNGGNPQTLKKNYLYATWSWPSNCSNPSGFDVVFCTGTDPTATGNYIVPIQKALGADRGLQIALPIKTTITGVNAFVRATYA
jgi:hypothetical protein